MAHNPKHKNKIHSYKQNKIMNLRVCIFPPCLSGLNFGHLDVRNIIHSFNITIGQVLQEDVYIHLSLYCNNNLIQWLLIKGKQFQNEKVYGVIYYHLGSSDNSDPWVYSRCLPNAIVNIYAGIWHSYIR